MYLHIGKSKNENATVAKTKEKVIIRILTIIMRGVCSLLKLHTSCAHKKYGLYRFKKEKHEQ